MLSNSQQFRPCTFLIKFTKRLKMLQMTFTKYAAKQQKYISAAKTSSQICCSTCKSKELTGSAERACSCWRVGGRMTSVVLPAAHFELLSWSEQMQSQQSPSFGKKYWQVTGWQHLSGYSDVQSRRNLISGASIEASGETKEGSTHLNSAHNDL